MSWPLVDTAPSGITLLRPYHTSVNFGNFKTGNVLSATSKSVISYRQLSNRQFHIGNFQTGSSISATIKPTAPYRQLSNRQLLIGKFKTGNFQIGSSISATFKPATSYQQLSNQYLHFGNIDGMPSHEPKRFGWNSDSGNKYRQLPTYLPTPSLLSIWSSPVCLKSCRK